MFQPDEITKETLVNARKRRLKNMTDDELERLNTKLIGRGSNWATQERIDVCREMGRRMAKFFAANSD